MKASELYDYMDSLAPFGTSENWDNAGLLVGSPERETGRVLVSLDVTPDTAAEAQRIGAGIILSHHPVIFHPLRSLPANGLYASLLRSDITVISAHTCLDFAAGGVNDVLAARLGLRSVRHFDMLPGGQLSLGRIGELERAMEPEEFAAFVKKTLGCGVISYVSGGRKIGTVAVSGGKLSTLPEKALRLGCDALVSSEIKHSDFLDAHALGLTLIDAGHYFTEVPVTAALAGALSAHFPGVDFVVSQTANPIKYM